MSNPPTLGPVSQVRTRIGQCQTCFYCTLDPANPTDLKTKVCRQGPPATTFLLVPIMDPRTRQQGMAIQRQSGWPIVKDEFGCGQHREKLQ